MKAHPLKLSGTIPTTQPKALTLHPYCIEHCRNHQPRLSTTLIHDHIPITHISSITFNYTYHFTPYIESHTCNTSFLHNSVITPYVVTHTYSHNHIPYHCLMRLRTIHLINRPYIGLLYNITYLSIPYLYTPRPYHTPTCHN